MTEVTYTQIDFGSEFYKQSLQLREKILRAPIGMVLRPEDVEGEETQYHFAAIVENQVRGTLVFKSVDTTRAKLRQMAICDTLQGKGVGRNIVEIGEDFLRAHGFEHVSMTARIAASEFYKKLGYKPMKQDAPSFTVPIINMEKYL